MQKLAKANRISDFFSRSATKSVYFNPGISPSSNDLFSHCSSTLRVARVFGV